MIASQGKAICSSHIWYYFSKEIRISDRTSRASEAYIGEKYTDLEMEEAVYQLTVVESEGLKYSRLFDDFAFLYCRT